MNELIEILDRPIGVTELSVGHIFKMGEPNDKVGLIRLG